ncbi:Guanine nucleotide exchange factor for Cdc42p [Malassezia yamatoensis]|uniref:Guanine nucleotide exchange factor for Cdc42p n=1 Tax=Malassezia yamatoensis TaxID=253288 RepID=A0AAJ6CF37_9BASI|nr:Guanine nucleotide exchange factor for Cdc42p [Malassezia yamatoensis]
MVGAADGSLGTGSSSVRAVPTAPVPANIITNKQATPGSGLYQSCVSLRQRLWCVPGFGEEFLEPIASVNNVMTNGRSSGGLSIQFDPVTHLWQCFRLGTPLCKLFNQLSPRLAEIPLTVETNLSNANACKALVMRFLIALKEKLGWEPEDTFTVSQLYLNDTNGFVRVIRTVDKLLDLLAQHHLLNESLKSPRPESNEFLPTPLDSPSDQRTHVVRELVESERKYVHDLEILQSYAMALSQTELISADTFCLIFGNLNQLVDVQRRFLICIEENARRPLIEQRFGGIFRDMEEDFSVYEPFCANYAQALDVIVAETSTLSRAKMLPASQNWYLDPSYELPTFMIKPVQRICKYPLLLEQLLKSTSRDVPGWNELAEALPIIKRITDKVNETSRRQENMQTVKDLESRVEDWKGHCLKSFGDLLLSDTFLVSKGESEREFHVYLFETILLCCKEVNSAAQASTSSGLLSSGSSRGRKQSTSLLKQRQASVSGSNAKKDTRSTLQLKGRIFMNNIVGINAAGRPGGFPQSPVGSYALHVWWRGESDVESFSLKCKNDEQLRLWQGTLQKLLDDLTFRRQQSASQATTPTTPSMPHHGLHLNLSGTHNPRPGARNLAFMQVATPIVGTPNMEQGIPRRLWQREHSMSSHRSEDETPYDASSGISTPIFPQPPSRSYTETDAMAMLNDRPSNDELGKPAHESWSNYHLRPASDELYLSTQVSSPTSTVTNTCKSSTTKTQAGNHSRPAFPPSNTHDGIALPASPEKVSMLSRNPAQASAHRTKKLPAHLVLPKDTLEHEMQSLTLGPLPMQRIGSFNGREMPPPPSMSAQLNNLNMQRTASEGSVMRGMPLNEFSTPSSGTPMTASNPYFPSIPGSPTIDPRLDIHMKASDSNSAYDLSRSLTNSRTASSNSSYPNTKRNMSESNIHLPIHPISSGQNPAPHANHSLLGYASPISPGTVPSLQVRVHQNGQMTQFRLSDVISCTSLQDLVQSQSNGLQANQSPTQNSTENSSSPKRFFYIDKDGDRVSLLDDEDLAMALDDIRTSGGNQLDLIVE